MRKVKLDPLPANSEHSCWRQLKTFMEIISDLAIIVKDPLETKLLSSKQRLCELTQVFRHLGRFVRN